MVGRADMAVFCIALLVLAGCDNKPKPGAAPVPPAQASAAQTTANCPSPPGGQAIENALSAAMQDVYGAEDATVKFVVTAVARADCDHLTVSYHAAGTTETHTSALAYASDGGWRLAFYKKQYPVR